MRKLFAVLSVLFCTTAFAASSVESTRLVFDSQTVASGATWTSPSVPLVNATGIEVFADNTSGGGFRDLMMTSYSDPTCATTIDSVLLRKVAWGAAFTGSSFAPGRVRGYIGPSVHPGSSGWYVLADVTGTANAANNLSNVFVEDSDSLWLEVRCSGTSTVDPLLFAVDLDDSGTTMQQYAVTGHAIGDVIQQLLWTTGGGTGLAPMTIAGHTSVMSGPIPRRFNITTQAAGTGITNRVRVMSRGRVPGTFTIPMVLPACAKFSLSAANGTVRAWGFAR